MRRVKHLVFSVMLVSGCAPLSVRPTHPIADVIGSDVQSSMPLIIAHRGYSAIAPENTLPAFALAATARADLVELDYHETKDGVLVVLHDFTLDRTSNADETFKRKDIRVDETAWDDIRALDAGSWYDARFKGTWVPSLDEAIATIHQHSVTLIERKSGSPETLVKFLEERNLTEKVVVQSFSYTFLKELHALAPNLRLWLLGTGVIPETDWEVFKEAGIESLAWMHHDVNAEVVARAHKEGITVIVFTVDSVPRAYELRSLGIDGIITNDPMTIRKALQSHGQVAMP